MAKAGHAVSLDFVFSLGAMFEGDRQGSMCFVSAARFARGLPPKMIHLFWLPFKHGLRCDQFGVRPQTQCSTEWLAMATKELV